MATLYELCDEMIELQDMMEDPDVDAGAIKHAMELKKDEICSKAVGYLKVLANTTADRTAIHEEIARLTEREKKKKTKEESLTEAILAAMQLCGVDKIETSLFTAKAKLSNDSVTITDEELLDPKFIKEKRSTSIDKTAIKKAILAGEDVEGASIEKTLSLVVS